MQMEMAEEQPKRLSQSPTGESSKKTKVLSAPNCLLSGAGVKEEPGEGEVALGGGGSRAGAAAAEQAGPAVERPRIDISIEAQLLHCAVAECNRPLKPPIFKVIPQPTRSGFPTRRNLSCLGFCCAHGENKD